MTAATEAPATILIIDDSRASRESLAELVRAQGHVAVTAASGAEGLKILPEVSPSVVLLDVVMPILDGFKVAAAIRALPIYVPIIMLTALNDFDSKRRGQSAGADDFLSKPIHAVELQIRVAAMLRIKTLTDALNTANRRLAELADTDGLTGVANRRRLEALIAVEHERARRYRRPLSLLMVDLDHFKSVNDTHGHAVGDDVLRRVAKALATTVRKSDFVGRYGGEEFVVLAPELSGSGIVVLAERLRSAVAQVSIETVVAPLKLTASIGVAWREGASEQGAIDLLKRADEAMYRAKAQGRDRVEVA